MKPAAATPPAAAATTGTPSVEQVWTRLRPDLVACYEAGRKKVPEMMDGKITLHASIDATGKTMCVVPGDDTGLTQDVEDCMRERLGREAYPAGKAEWSIAVPVVLRQGVLALGTVSTQPTIGMIESRGLTEELYDVIDSLSPDVKVCLRGTAKTSERRVVVVGARVGSDGAVTCALASSTSAVPAESRRCVADVFKRGRFRPPKGGVGLLTVPIEVRSGT